MSEDNLRIVRSLYEAFGRRDNAAAFELYHPDIVWDARDSPGSEDFPYDLAGIYHGHDGVVRFWRGWLSAWSRIEFEVLELHPEEDRVLAWLRQHNVGRASGVRVDQGEYGQLWTISGGLATRMEVCGRGKEDALRRLATGPDRPAP